MEAEARPGSRQGSWKRFPRGHGYRDVRRPRRRRGHRRVGHRPRRRLGDGVAPPGLTRSSSDPVRRRVRRFSNAASRESPPATPFTHGTQSGSLFQRGPGDSAGERQSELVAHHRISQASMRPRRFRRGEATSPCVRPPKAPNASMRPRRFRRGEGSGSVRWALNTSRRFNEAPAIPPGRGPLPTLRSTPVPRCFNEAPAIPPGRACRRDPRRSPATSFNEAPAIPPGRDPRPDGSTLPRRTASMRPRRFRRGEPWNGRRASWITLELQ